MNTNYGFLNPLRKNCANIRLLLYSPAFVSVVLQYLVHSLGTTCRKNRIGQFLHGCCKNSFLLCLQVTTKKQVHD